MKPPTKDWSSEHQSPSCKSSLFQTTGVLIQTPPVGEVLVRNQYSSWGGSLTHPLQRPVEVWKVYPLVKGLKSLSTPSSTDRPGGALMQLSKVQSGFIILKFNSRTLQHVLIFRWVVFFISELSLWEQKLPHSLSNQCTVANGNMINNFKNSMFLSPKTTQALQPLLLSCHSL